MLSIFVQTLWESLHKRVAIAMIVVAILVGALQLSAKFENTPKGLYVISGHSRIDAPAYARNQMATFLAVTGNIWLFLGLFAVAPLLSSHLEKGWAEMLFSKGVARWQMVTARALGAFAVYIFTLALLALPTCYIAWRSGVSVKPLFGALLIGLFSFWTYMATMLLVSTSQPNVVLLIGGALIQMLLSSALASRVALYGVITWKWVQWLMDWAYRILPKNFELARASQSYFATQHWPEWWLVWSSAVFAVAAIAWSLQRFQRRMI